MFDKEWKNKQRKKRWSKTRELQSQRESNPKEFLVKKPTPKPKKRKGPKPRKAIVQPKESWAKEYATKQWDNCRRKILERDSYKCALCSSIQSLQVHHKIYDIHLHVWEYHPNHLITLCEDCHRKEHSSKKLTEFYNKHEPLQPYYYR